MTPAAIVRRQLDEVAAIVMAADRAIYTARPIAASGSIGEHVRHCLDHIAALVAATPSRAMSYDRRERGTAVERDPAEALRADYAPSGVGRSVGRNRSMDDPVCVTSLVTPAGESVTGWSTLGRELAYVNSHTDSSPGAHRRPARARGRAGARLPRARAINTTESGLMCTVSIVAHAGGLRMISNRDERLDRAIARQPTRRLARAACGGDATRPDRRRDSWIGVNDAWPVAAVLNRYPVAPRDADGCRTTRGALVRWRSRQNRSRRRSRRCAAWTRRTLQPFRLVLAHRNDVGVSPGTAASWPAPRRRLANPHVHRVAPRRLPRGRPAPAAVRLADGRCGAPLRGQAMFHRHHGRTSATSAFVMERADAATVSRTTVDVSRRGMSARV